MKLHQLFWIALSAFVLVLVLKEPNKEPSPQEIKIRTFACTADNSLSVSPLEKIEEIKVFVGNKYGRPCNSIKKDQTYRYFQPSKKGNYFIQYENIFGQSLDTTILINEHTDSIKLCVDKFREREPSKFLKNLLDNGGEWSLRVKKQGCFYFNEINVTIQKEGDFYFLEMNDARMTQLRKVIGEEQLVEFEKYEEKIRILPDGGMCTTQKEFEVEWNDQSYKKTDRSCAWNGIAELYGIIGLTF